MTFVVYSQRRCSHMAWTLASQGGMKPCHRRQEFDTLAAAEELAARVGGDAEVLPVTPAPAPVAVQEEAYW
jgi:hypothetical protein